jgi:hypothetical protein
LTFALSPLAKRQNRKLATDIKSLIRIKGGLLGWLVHFIRKKSFSVEFRFGRSSGGGSKCQSISTRGLREEKNVRWLMTELDRDLSEGDPDEIGRPGPLLDFGTGHSRRWAWAEHQTGRTWTRTGNFQFQFIDRRSRDR